MKLAERRLAELRDRVGGLVIGKEGRQTFDEVAKRWMTVTAHTLKPSSALRRELCIRPFLLAHRLSDKLPAPQRAGPK